MGLLPREPTRPQDPEDWQAECQDRKAVLAQQRKFAPQSLTTYAILDAFPKEAKYLVPRELKRLKAELQFNFDIIRALRDDTSDPEFSQFQILVEKEYYMPKKKVEHFSNLKAMERLMCKTTRGTTNEDIEKSKLVDIWRLYDFQNVHGSMARCPFHQDDTPSFRIKGNKFLCFGCGIRGDAIDFIQNLNHIPFYKAVDYLVKHG